MRNLILPVLLILGLSSCGTYQYLTVDSSELQKDDQKQLTAENDTLRVSYGFSGGGGPVTITAFNKTNQPMFINWAKSAIIRDGQSFSLYGANSAFVGSATPTGTGTADLTGTVSVPPGTEFTMSNTFYVGTVMETHYAPAMFKLYHEPGDQYYVFWQT